MFGLFSFMGARTGAWLSPGLSSCQSKQSLSSACCWGSSARPPPSLLGRLKRPPVAKWKDSSKTVPTQTDQSKHIVKQHNTDYKYKSLGSTWRTRHIPLRRSQSSGTWIEPQSAQTCLKPGMNIQTSTVTLNISKYRLHYMIEKFWTHWPDPCQHCGEGSTLCCLISVWPGGKSQMCWVLRMKTVCSKKETFIFKLQIKQMWLIVLIACWNCKVPELKLTFNGVNCRVCLII